MKNHRHSNMLYIIFNTLHWAYAEFFTLLIEQEKGSNAVVMKLDTTINAQKLSLLANHALS